MSDSGQQHEQNDKDVWNRREHKSPFLFYVLLTLLCLILAYALSGTAR